MNAVLGFTNMLLKLLEDTDADHIGVIFDAGRATFRNEKDFLEVLARASLVDPHRVSSVCRPAVSWPADS